MDQFLVAKKCPSTVLEDEPAPVLDDSLEVNVDPIDADPTPTDEDQIEDDPAPTDEDRIEDDPAPAVDPIEADPRPVDEDPIDAKPSPINKDHVQPVVEDHPAPTVVVPDQINIMLDMWNKFYDLDFLHISGNKEMDAKIMPYSCIKSNGQLSYDVDEFENQINIVLKESGGAAYLVSQHSQNSISLKPLINFLVRQRVALLVDLPEIRFLFFPPSKMVDDYHQKINVHCDASLKNESLLAIVFIRS